MAKAYRDATVQRPADQRLKNRIGMESPLYLRDRRCVGIQHHYAARQLILGIRVGDNFRASFQPGHYGRNLAPRSMFGFGRILPRPTIHKNVTRHRSLRLDILGVAAERCECRAEAYQNFVRMSRPLLFIPALKIALQASSHWSPSRLPVPSAAAPGIAVPAPDE